MQEKITVIYIYKLEPNYKLKTYSLLLFFEKIYSFAPNQLTQST